MRVVEGEDGNEEEPPMTLSAVRAFTTCPLRGFEKMCKGGGEVISFETFGFLNVIFFMVT